MSRTLIRASRVENFLKIVKRVGLFNRDLRVHRDFFKKSRPRNLLVTVSIYINKTIRLTFSEMVMVVKYRLLRKFQTRSLNRDFRVSNFELISP